MIASVLQHTAFSSSQGARTKIAMPAQLSTILLLIASNCFMTLAWYGHLRTLHNAPWLLAVIASWGIAFFEYLLQVPANRIGAVVYSLPQLKIIQEVITLSVFVPYALIVARTPIRQDYLWAALCLMGAVYFIFRGA